jgi:hypothetical protein
MKTQQQQAAPLRGYQWKTLFLPDASKLRMRYARQSYYAEVVGEELLYQGDSLSPSQFAKAVAGDGRNAWRDLWIRFPGEKNWTLAATLRGSADNAKQPLSQPSQIEAVSAAAKCMSQALQAALLLVEHSNAQSERKHERRAVRHRRLEDVMIDDCKND